MDTIASPSSDGQFKSHCVHVGQALGDSLRGLLGDLPKRTGEIAHSLGIDKVLASRLMKAARAGDPLATLHAAPGPEPLRRVIAAAAVLGVPASVLHSATKSVAAFEQLIRENARDRTGLNSILSAWLPEARREFELRRKQAAYRALSEIRGSSAETSLGTVILHPSETPGSIDLVWVFGVVGLRRARPGVRVRLASRRSADVERPRQPMTLGLDRVDDFRGLRLQEFCSSPAVDIEVHDSGEVVHYLISDGRFDLMSRVDLVFAEVNLAEIKDTLHPGSTRSAYFFSEIATPVRRNLFDVLVHEDVYSRSTPRLVTYDTSFEGVASANDRSRDLDVLDLDESIDFLGKGLDRFRTSVLPNYAGILDRVFRSLDWGSDAFRGYRSLVEFPVYGSQITVVFDPPGAPLAV